VPGGVVLPVPGGAVFPVPGEAAGRLERGGLERLMMAAMVAEPAAGRQPPRRSRAAMKKPGDAR
jgi:hypothetical protein